MIQERKKIIPDEENLIWAKDQVRKVKILSLGCFWKERRETIERDRRRMTEKSRGSNIQKIIILDRSRGVERYRGLKRMFYLSKSCPASIERCPQLNKLDGSRQLSRSYRASKKFLDGSKQLSRSCQESDKSS